MPDLRMNSNGKPDPSRATKISEGVYQGDGWTYEIGIASDTLTLESGKYDFNYTFPGFRNNESTHDPSDEHLNCVNVVNIVVQPGATIVGGVFEEIGLLNNGTVTNGLFRGTDVKNNGTLNCLFKSKPFGIGYHSLTAADNLAVEVLLYSFGNTESFWSNRTIYFTGTPTLTVKVDNNPIQCINGRADYGDLKPSGVSGYYTFTPNAGEDVVLNLNYYITDLVITKDGFPDTTGREPIYQDNAPTKQLIGYRGNGWKYESGTLTLERGEYNFSKDGLGQLAPDVNLVVTGATLTGGAFNEIPHGLTADNVQPIILNGSGSIEAVNDLSSEKWSKTLYAIKGSQVEIKASVPLTDINCRAINSRYYLDNNDKTALRFTTRDSFLETYGGPELILNKSSRTNLIMKEDGSPDLEGIPYDRSGEYLADIYTGDGWRYVDGISDYLELTAHSYNFRYCDPLNNKISSELAAVTCDITNSSGATIEDGIFKN